MERINKFLKKNFPITVKDSVITVVTLSVTVGVCSLLSFAGDTEVYVPLIFVLAVAVISWVTNGYFFGVSASFIAVFGVNYAFTYPYFKFNFTISGYPLTFVTILAVSMIISTMTTRLKYQEKLKSHTEQELMRANLLRAISHDLRTPLTSIIGSVSAIIDNDEYLTSQQRCELLNGVKEEAQWLIRMVENLLSITHISGNQASSIDKRPEAVEEILGEVVQKFKKQFDSVKISISIPDELLFVPMDAMLIEQVLMNLMHNSIEHGQTTTCINVSVCIEGKEAVFSVSDDGVGIDKKHLQTIFDGSLNSGDSHVSADYSKNMGIGLSVCKTIVEGHGGSMYAENLPLGGAKVYFKLPIE